MGAYALLFGVTLLILAFRLRGQIAPRFTDRSGFPRMTARAVRRPSEKRAPEPEDDRCGAGGVDRVVPGERPPDMDAGPGSQGQGPIRLSTDARQKSKELTAINAIIAGQWQTVVPSHRSAAGGHESCVVECSPASLCWVHWPCRSAGLFGRSGFRQGQQYNARRYTVDDCAGSCRRRPCATTRHRSIS